MSGLFYAMGYSGHGVQMSVHMGQQMAAVMAGEAEREPVARSCRGRRFPAISGRPGSCPSSAPITACRIACTERRDAPPYPSAPKNFSIG